MFLELCRDSPTTAASLWPQRGMKTAVSRAFGKLRISARYRSGAWMLFVKLIVRRRHKGPPHGSTHSRRFWRTLDTLVVLNVNQRCGVTGLSDLSPCVFGHPMV